MIDNVTKEERDRKQGQGRDAIHVIGHLFARLHVSGFRKASFKNRP